MELISLQSLKRLTGQIFCQVSGDSNYIPIGNILKTGIDVAPKYVSAKLKKRGRSILFRRDASDIEPIFSFSTDQFPTSSMPLLFMATRLADAVQTSSGSATFVFTAAKGRAFKIPYRGVTITSVAVAAANKVLNTDFYVDDPNIPQSLVSINSWIILPETPAGIADGDTVTVTYTRPALTQEQYALFTTLNRTVTLYVYGEDETGLDPNQVYTMTGQLSVKKMGELTDDKFAEVDLELAIFGNPTLGARPN
jgi:hypothetical protein